MEKLLIIVTNLQFSYLVPGWKWNTEILQSLSSELFRDEENISIKRYVSISNECLLYCFRKFCSGQSDDHDVQIRTVKKSVPLQTDAEDEQWDGFSVGE